MDYMDLGLLTYSNVRKIVESKDFKLFSDPFDLNIIGVRTKDKTPNVFNDYLLSLYTDSQSFQHIKIYPATTDPGLYWLEHPENAKGTAILKPGQYPQMWKVGMHLGKYRALVQYRNCTVYRDANRDGNLDIIPGTEDTGIFGINYHHAGENSQLVENWSAGCQVHQKLSNFNEAMGIVDLQIKAGLGDIFTYTLLEEKDF